MIRCRFWLALEEGEDDYRPVEWPIRHPYWCTGYALTEDRPLGVPILVAYADDEAEVLRLWPEARDLDSVEVHEYLFTDRFPRPSWFKEKEQTRSGS